MKQALALSLLLCVFSSASMSGEITKKHGEAIGMSYVGVMVVTGVYATTGAVAGAIAGVTTAAVITEAEVKARREAAAKLLLNDVQNFYQAGNLSINLQSAIALIKEANAELSDAEALDQLNLAALSILR